VIDNVFPASGQYGTIVTITGQRLFGGGTSVSRVTLGDIDSQLLSETTEEIVVRADASLTSFTGDVVIIANTGATITAENAWEYLVPGVITDVNPPQGVQGTRVTIRGERLLGGGVNLTDVSLKNVSAIVVSFSDTEIQLVVSEPLTETPGLGDVVIVSDTGSRVIEDDGFRYLTPGVVTTSPNPAYGQHGTRVEICGDGLLGGGSMFEFIMLGVHPAERIHDQDSVTGCVTFEV